MYIQVGNVLKNMANIKSLSKHKEAKKAKVYVEHLTAILKVINLSISALARFEVYNPVREILATLRQQKSIVEAYLEKNKKLLKENEES